MSNTTVADKPKPAKLHADKPADAALKTDAPKKGPAFIPLGKYTLPERVRSGPGASVYPWRTLEPGEAFFVPGTTVKMFGGLASSTSKRMTAKLSPNDLAEGKKIKFVVRGGQHEGVDGVFVGRES